jgi:hypothetical protein
MKKLGIIAAVIAVAAGGGHYVLWKQQAALLDSGIERLIQQSGETGKITFTYERKTIGGYPMDATVRYVNPTFAIAPEVYATEGQAASFPMQLETVKLDGDMVVRNAFIQNKTSAELTGRLHLAGKKQEKPFSYVSTWSGVNRCSVTLADAPTAFITGKHQIQAAKTPQDFVRAFHAADCHTKDMVVRDEMNNKELATIAHQEIHLTSSPSAQTGQHKIGVNMTIKDALFQASNMNQLDGLEEMIAGGDAAQAESIVKLVEKHPIPWLDTSLAGKQNMTLRGEYEGSLDAVAPPARITVEDLSISNDFYEMKWPLSVVISEDNNLMIRHNGTLKHTEAFDRVVRESIDALLAIVRDDELQVSDDVRAKLKALDDDAVHGLVPSFAPAGEIRTMANLDMNQATMSGTIDEVGFTTAEFGLTAKGTVNPLQQQGDGQIICQSCELLITRVSHYINDATSVMATMEGTPARFKLSDEAITALVSFVQEYDTDETPDTVTITLKNGADGKPLISGKDMGMVMMNALGKLSPHFGAPQP